MGNQTVQLFEGLFAKKMRLGVNSICQHCDAVKKEPLLPWLVGSRYFDSKERILFIGKPHRGTAGRVLESGIQDPVDNVKNDYTSRAWAYWSYTKAIASEIYGDEPWNWIGLTNIIKCTNTGHEGNDTKDSTTTLMAKSCIIDNGTIFKEIEILQPLNLVFFTYSFYRDALRDLPKDIFRGVTEITDEQHKKPCGNKTMGWWERRAKTSWSDKVRILVTGHPERMRKEDYVSLVSGWLTSR